MRKAVRQKDKKWALDVFDRAPYITMSMVRPNGTPYGLFILVAPVYLKARVSPCDQFQYSFLGGLSYLFRNLI